MNTLRFVLFFCLISLSYSISAQEITVRDLDTNEPISGVAAYNKSKTKSVISDFDGKVTIDKFDNDEIIFFKHLTHIEVSFLKSKIPSIIYLQPNTQNLDEVVISASKFEQSKKEVPQKIISIKSEDIIFSAPQTSTDLLQNSGQIFIQKSQLGGEALLLEGFQLIAF